MRAYIRRAAVPAVVLSVALLAGCSSGDDSTDAAPTKSPAAEAPVEEAAAEPSEATSSSAPAAPVVKVGETAEFGVGETDEYGENYKVTTKMSVTVVEAKYVTPAEIGTSNKPQGQFVKLTLKLENVGNAPAEIMLYGMMKWEDSDTAAQDASTLEGVGEGPELDTTYKPGQSVTGSLVLDVGRKGGTVGYYGVAESEEAAFVVELPSS
jgi:outer membrane murein-binding lipoprotein Lpp